MYITDLTHYLDAQGAIPPRRGPAKAMAEFLGACAAAASGGDRLGLKPPRCFKCKKTAVETALTKDAAVYWRCPHCQAEGRISNWRNTLWDLRDAIGQTS